VSVPAGMSLRLLLILQTTITSLDGLYRKQEEPMMIREDLIEIRRSIPDRDSEVKPTPRIEQVKNATLVPAIGPTQQSLDNLRTKCKVDLVSNCITQDGDYCDQ